MKLPVPDYILSITPYSPGKPLEELEREYGIRDSIKLASNENPLGPSPLAKIAIEKALTGLHRYPDAAGYYLVRGIAEKLGLAPENIVLGNGSDEIIGLLTQAFLVPGCEVILPKPSFQMYDILVRSAGAKPVYVPLKSLAIDMASITQNLTENTRMVFLTHPHNPTGAVISKGEFEHFLKAVPRETVIVIDEAYIDFVRETECLNAMEFFGEDRLLVMLRTFSKAYGLAGLRIAYGIMPAPIAELLNRIRLPFNASIPAQAGALAALQDDEFLEKTIRLIHDGLDFLSDALDRLSVRHFPSQANFILIDVQKSADDVFEQMLRRGVIVRSLTSYGYPEYIRVSVGLPEENTRFLNTLQEVL